MNTTNNGCFAYTRVSTAKQGEGVSLEAQKDALQAFADKNGLQILQWFEEKETAAKSGRPIFTSMIKQLLKGQANNLIIHKIDRSARNLADWAKIGDLSDRGINVHFATETLDFRSRGGRLTADIQAVIAADYVRNLREETIKGIQGRLKQGLYPFKAPIGYVNNGGGKPKTIDPVRGPLVRQIFEAYASEEYSLHSLPKLAKEVGLLGESGNTVGKTVIENMLSNPFYIGIIHLKKKGTVFKGAHAALISHRLFQKVADVRAGKSVKKVTRHNFTYRRVFDCARCGKGYIPERQKGIIYYRCHTRGCTHGSLREECLERQVQAALLKLRFPEYSLPILKSKLKSVFDSSTKRKKSASIPMQIQKIEERRARLVDALCDGLIDKATFEDRNRQLLLQESALEEQRSKSASKADIASSVAKLFELQKSLYLSHSLAIGREKRQLVKIAFSNRQVDGKNLVLEPQNWLLQAQNLCSVLVGAPDRITSRSGQQVIKTAIRQLQDALESEELQIFLNKTSYDQEFGSLARPSRNCLTKISNDAKRQ